MNSTRGYFVLSWQTDCWTADWNVCYLLTGNVPYGDIRIVRSTSLSDNIWQVT